MRRINSPTPSNPHAQGASFIAAVTMTLLALAMLALTPAMAAERFSGKAYYRWTYDIAGATAQGYHEFAFTRIYLNYEGGISEDISIKLTTDVANPGTEQYWSVFQKIASLQWNSRAGQWIIGLQGMNIWNVVEATWGYRFLEKTPMDLHSFGSSADLGLGYRHNLGERLHMHFTLTNGGGYKAAEDDRYKQLTGQVVYGAANLSKTSGYNIGAVMSLEPHISIAGADSTVKTTVLMALFGGLSVGSVRIGAEFDRRADWGDIPQQIFATYANLQMHPRLAVFGRVDLYDPAGSRESRGDEEVYILAGVSYAATTLFHIAPNLRFHNGKGSPAGKAGLTSISIDMEFRY